MWANVARVLKEQRRCLKILALKEERRCLKILALNGRIVPAPRLRAPAE